MNIKESFERVGFTPEEKLELTARLEQAAKEEIKTNTTKRNIKWVFEDVTLDFPDQTLRLEPNVEVPWLDGTTTVVGLDISPLSARVELEGGTCADYLAHANSDPFAYAEEEPTVTKRDDGIVAAVGSGGDWWEKLFEMEQAMSVEVTLQDGTILKPTSAIRQDEGYRESADGLEVPWLAWSRRYDDELSAQTTRVIDPTQVDHVTVCGVDIPVAPSGEN